MDYKTLVKRFTKACYRFEALQENLDILLFDTDDEIKYNEYEDLASQAAEIVLKLSANGHNVGEHFFNYYVRRLEYIVAYFRELFDDEETSLAEDEQDEQDDEPTAEGRLEGFPADCAFPKSPTFFIKKWAFKFTPTAKAEENAAEEDDGEDEQPDNENDTQAAESDEAADDVDREALFSPNEKSKSLSKYHGLEELSLADLVRVQETLEMWFKMNVITGRYVVNGKRLPAAETLRRGKAYCRAFSDAIVSGNTINILAGEIEVRRIICETIDAIPGFRDSERFKELIERYPTYKEKKQ